ncbi:hypothetical protein [Parasphingorhabdus marina]|uniref:hypothetical protein n=1 Tax=Parasphingorhabdus marina TaxID=394732 RepID=UPI000940D1FF|nr:hypothetical protein [Parasphingorhabdus marina]
MRARSSLRPARDRLVDHLLAGLRRHAHPDCRIRLVRERPWASITFSGTRYSFELSLAGRPNKDIFGKNEQALADHDFDLDGHFVADLLVTPASPTPRQHCQVEILVIVDPVDQR